MSLLRTRTPWRVARLAALIPAGMLVATLASAASPIQPSATAAPAPGGPEPAVQRHITTREDGTVVIEEVRVRGEVQNITVHPKKGSGLPDYEIVPSNRGRDPHTNGSGSRGAAGQRVWSILKF